MYECSFGGCGAAFNWYASLFQHVNLVHLRQKAPEIPYTELPPANFDAEFLLNHDHHDDDYDDNSDSDEEEDQPTIIPEYDATLTTKTNPKNKKQCGHYVLIFSVTVPSSESQDEKRYDVIKIGQSDS